MRRYSAVLSLVISLFFLDAVSFAQPPRPDVSQAPGTGAATSVPRIIRLAGRLQPGDGRPLAEVEIVTVRIYADESGDTVLWQETHSVTPDADGRYAVLLGSTQPDGVPIEVFRSGEARWVGTTLEQPGEEEGQRVRLASVPYALHASDAETLGGLPATAFVRAQTADQWDIQTNSLAAADVSGTANYLAKFTSNVDLGSSAVYETGGRVGIGTTVPLDTMHVTFTNTTGQFTGYAVQNLGSSPTSYSGMLFFDQNGALGQFQGFNNSTHEYRINNVASGGTINFMIGSQSRFLVANNGNIGIGTTTPAARLETVGSIFSTDYATFPAPTFIGRAARGTAAAPTAVQTGDTLALFGASGYYDGFLGSGFSGPVAGMRIVADNPWTFASRSAHLDFYTSSGVQGVGSWHAMTISGRAVGIGTPFPAARLEIAAGPQTEFFDPQDANVLATRYSGDSAAEAPGFIGRKARGEMDAPSAARSGDILAVFRGTGHDGANFGSGTGAEIAVVAPADWTDFSQPGQLRFRTSPPDALAFTDRMVITQTGTVGIGTLSPADRLQVVGDIRVGGFGTQGCIKRADGATLIGSCSSDARFKKDVTPFGRSLESVAALQPVHYFWRPAEFPDRHFGDTRAYGLIAQDAEQVLPELVTTDEEGYKAVDYAKLPLLTIQAVKELHAENEGLKGRITELERLVKQLLTRSPRRDAADNTGSGK